MVKLIRMECNSRIKSHQTPSKNQQPEHTHAVHSLTHTHSHSQDLCKPPVCRHCSRTTVEVLWSESYNIPPNSSSQPLLSHVPPCSLPPFWQKLHVLLSLSPMSGAFSMALNAMPPYFIEHIVGWCWIPPQCLAMGSCIRDVSFGRGAGGGWKEKI